MGKFVALTFTVFSALLITACGQSGVDSDGYCTGELINDYNDVTTTARSVSQKKEPTREDYQGVIDKAQALKSKYAGVVCSAEKITENGNEAATVNVDRKMDEIIELCQKIQEKYF